MSILFLTIADMSITASYVIVFIILVRLFLKKVPKVFSYALWGIAAFRLVIPFSFESIFSFIPRNIRAGSVSDIIVRKNPTFAGTAEIVDAVTNNSAQQKFIYETTGASFTLVEALTLIWLIGIAAMLIYSILSVYKLKESLEFARLTENNIYEVENLRTPFVLGFVNVKIYLPTGISDNERRFVLLHEQTHISRKDHITKILAFLILSIHWFNPFAWLAFRLMCIDMELSCDEHVLKKTKENIRCSYANSLVSLAVNENTLNGSPIAFGEGNIKRRIKNIMNYRKCSFWLVTLSMIAVIAIAVGLLTNPVGKSITDIIEILGTQPYKPEALVYLGEFSSYSENYFFDNMKENEYTFSTVKFEVQSETERNNVQIDMPVYKEENIGSSATFNGFSPLDMSKYANRRCFSIMTEDGKNTGYTIYKLDDEIWISHWGLYGEKKDKWWCEYVLKLRTDF